MKDAGNGRELAVRKGQAPNQLMALAIEKGNVDLDKLEKLMLLQERWEENQARKAYSVAMTAFKADPPDIGKDKHVKFSTSKGPMEYKHATLGNVTDKINSSLSQHGLSAGWKTKQEGNTVTVTCIISHAMGHSEQTSLTASLDESGGKNIIQALGSTISYLERYTILALTGLATREMDDDGKATQEVEYISDQQISTITDMVNSKNIDLTKFLAYMGVEYIDKIQGKDFNKAMTSLRAAKGGAK
jgi:hypothetical protein